MTNTDSLGNPASDKAFAKLTSENGYPCAKSNNLSHKRATRYSTVLILMYDYRKTMATKIQFPKGIVITSKSRYMLSGCSNLLKTDCPQNFFLKIKTFLRRLTDFCQKIYFLKKNIGFYKTICKIC